jgi:hypothetical protein
LDKVADALIGESENSPDSKYALICQNCFTHNGLVLREELNDTRQSSHWDSPKAVQLNPFDLLQNTDASNADTSTFPDERGGWQGKRKPHARGMSPWGLHLHLDRLRTNSFLPKQGDQGTINPDLILSTVPVRPPVLEVRSV